MIRRRILLRCDGGSIAEIGTGHVRRCLALADELAKDTGNNLCFLMRDTDFVGRVRGAGHAVQILEGDAREGLLRAACEHESDIVFIDNLGRSSQAIRALQDEGRIVISMDDEESPELADISISPAFPASGATHTGLDRSILLQPLPERPAPNPEWDLFVSFGGFDPADLSGAFAKSWIATGSDARVLLAVGAAHANLDELRALVKPSSIELRTEVDFTKELPRARLALTNGGTTLFMAAAHGVPSIAVAQYGHQVANAIRLAERGAASFHGQAPEVRMDEVLREVHALLASPADLAARSRAGRCAFPGLGLRDAVQTLSIVEELAWDSAFFARRIATLHPRRLTAGILRFALEQCRSQNIECLYFLSHADHAPTAELAAQHGFRAVDDRLTFTIEPLEASLTPEAKNHVRAGHRADGPRLAAIAGASYGASRYFHDDRFPRERCEQFYRDWILKSLEGHFDDEVLVAEVQGELAGYISCRAVTPNLGSIGLVGIHEDFRGRGLGKQLVHAALHWFAARDLPRVEVVTQGRNVPAQKLYESCGFVLQRWEKWYHNWLDEH